MINDRQKNIFDKLIIKLKIFKDYSEKHLGKKLGCVISIIVIATVIFAAFLILESAIMSVPVQFWLFAIFLVLLLK